MTKRPPVAARGTLAAALVYPPVAMADEAGWMAGLYNHIPPLGIAYLAARLRQDGHRVACFDSSGGRLTPGQLLDALARFSPDLVGISASTFAIPGAQAVTAAVRERLPRAVVVLGGAHVSAVPARAMDEVPADAGVIGEGEEAIADCARVLAGGDRDLEAVAGLIVRRDDGTLATTAPRPPVHDLDRLPMPAWDLLPPPGAYSPTPASYRRLPLAHLFTSRGCPYRCTFCDRSVFGGGLRKHSVARVVDEVETLVRRFGVREVRFFDDVFTADKARAVAIAEGIRRRVGRIPWTCLTRPDLVDPAFLKEIRRLGCWQVLMGLESTSQDRLDGMQKGFDVAEAETAVRQAREAGLKVRGDFIIGLPGETREQMRSSLAFAIQSGLDMAHFNIWIPYPGAPLTKDLEDRGLIRHRDYSRYGGEGKRPGDDEILLPYVPEGFDEKEYVAEVERLYDGFYKRPGYIVRQALSIRTVHDVRRYWLGFKAFFLSR